MFFFVEKEFTKKNIGVIRSHGGADNFWATSYFGGPNRWFFFIKSTVNGLLGKNKKFPSLHFDIHEFLKKIYDFFLTNGKSLGGI